jgi:hypothetical protein
MAEHILKTIDDALLKLKSQEEAVILSKKFINQLCEFAQIPEKFPNISNPENYESTGIKRNAYYGLPLATCVGQFLEMKAANGTVKEATLDEIMAALKDGGFDLSAISKDPDGQRRGVAITLAKNSAKFHRLPNGDFGLTSWYPNIKAKKEKITAASETEGPTAPDIAPLHSDNVASSEKQPPQNTDFQPTNPQS